MLQVSLAQTAQGVVYPRRNADTLKRLQDTEKLQKEQSEAAYVNLDVSNEEKEKGNQVGQCLGVLCNNMTKYATL